MFENLSDRLERSFKLLKGQGTITEIKAAALGIRYWHPESHAVIDIGGQD